MKPGYRANATYADVILTAQGLQQQGDLAEAEQTYRRAAMIEPDQSSGSIAPKRPFASSRVWLRGRKAAV